MPENRSALEECSARASVNIRATMSSIRSQSARLTSTPATYSSVVRCRIASNCSDDLTTATAVFNSCAASLTNGAAARRTPPAVAWPP